MTKPAAALPERELRGVPDELPGQRERLVRQADIRLMCRINFVNFDHPCSLPAVRPPRS